MYSGHLYSAPPHVPKQQKRCIFMYLSDMHTHSIASGHGTECTITNMARAAAEKGLRLLGITDHGPGTLAAGTSSYFRSLTYSPKKHFGVDLLYGIELNILDRNGSVDLDQELLCKLDYAIASMHTWNYRPGTRDENTEAFVNVMKNPCVKILGHSDNTHYPVNYDVLARTARETGTIFEINEASLAPYGYRGDTRENCYEILRRCCSPVTVTVRNTSVILPVLLNLFIRPCSRNS